MTPDEHDRHNGHRWRILAARVLVDVETQATRADLPLLDWSVGTMKLIGRPLPGRTSTEIRADWQAWVDHLEAEPIEGAWTSLSTGAELLQATVKRSPGSGHSPVTVLLLGEIAPPLEGETDEEHDARLAGAADTIADHTHIEEAQK